MHLNSWGSCAVGLLGLCLFLSGCTGCGDSVAPPDPKPKNRTSIRAMTAVYLEQGWEDEERERFYYLVKVRS
jgi:hypothetical protein